MIQEPVVTPAEQPQGIDAARLDMRTVGYCVMCDRIVERADGGSCPCGHPASAVAGRVVLADEDPVPSLPRFNIAAFLLPPVWGPAHGQWAGAIFLPMWMFADSTLRTAGENAATMIAAVVVSVGTLAAMYWFGKRGNGLAWRRQWERVTVAEYVRRERLWAFVSVPVAACLFAAALYFDLVVLPARGL